MMIKRLASTLLVAAAAASCSGPTDPSSNTITPFSGTVQPNSFGPPHAFTINNSGEILITVQTMLPGNAFLGVGYGQPSGGGCALIQQGIASSASLGKTALTAQALSKGSYCVVLFDPTSTLGIAPLTIGQNYTGTVSHP